MLKAAAHSIGQQFVSTVWVSYAVIYGTKMDTKPNIDLILQFETAANIVKSTFSLNYTSNGMDKDTNQPKCHLRITTTK